MILENQFHQSYCESTLIENTLPPVVVGLPNYSYEIYPTVANARNSLIYVKELKLGLA